MSWQEGVAITVVLLGLGAGAFLLAQQPSFWIEFGQRLARALLPRAVQYLTRGMPPEEEKAVWRSGCRTDRLHFAPTHQFQWARRSTQSPIGRRPNSRTV